jgi:BirA family transcriptional regulator, biotin operon repressor / biotin---[acetyl-CoA-carboxylase] ligase
VIDEHPSSSATDVRYDGWSAEALAQRLELPRVLLLETVGSTMDVAHELGQQGAPAGTLVLADEQTAGRGRKGQRWHSARGGGIWLTLLERPRDAGALDVLSLRLGTALAVALDPYAGAAVGVKWPNDLFVGRGKLAGVLVEARWRAQRLDWVAIGFGVNVSGSDHPTAASLRPGVSRSDVLQPVLRAMRAACGRHGSLQPDELEELARRDIARGRRSLEPAEGRVAGVDAQGQLVIDTDTGPRAFRAGSLVLAEDS